MVLVVEHFYERVRRNWWFCLWKSDCVKIVVAGKTMAEKGKQRSLALVVRI